VADQLLTQRDKSSLYKTMRSHDGLKTKIHTYQAEILPGRNGNLEHVSNWALNKARELEVDLLVFLQDFIWIPEDAVAKFSLAAKNHPFDLLTGNVVSSPGHKVETPDSTWSIFGIGDSDTKPPPPYEPDTRDAMGLWKFGDKTVGGTYLDNHAWEINWGALPHALINAGVDFDEDYDYGTQWGNTDFSFNIAKKLSRGSLQGVHQGGRVWWDHNNQAISMPHREYFPKAHEGERNIDNGWRFWEKHPELVGAA
jgi:hypothetical protein